jgi:UDP-N-acetylmuramate dehydrogenase
MIKKNESVILRDVELKNLTTFKVGGKAKYFTEIKDEKDIEHITEFLTNHEAPVMFLGRGSNVLISDKGFNGLVIKSCYSKNPVVESNLITFAAGYPLPRAAKDALKLSFTGFEWAIGVPGSIGGALPTNAGCHNQQTSDTFFSAKVFDIKNLTFKQLGKKDLHFCYRKSDLKDCYLVLSVTHKFSHGDPNEIKKTMENYLNYRRVTQPRAKNAGSVFINPEGYFAGKLIEEAGLKGFVYKSARISPVHANFIESLPNAKASDIYDLIKIVQDKVLRMHAIELKLEIKLYGFDDAN